MNEWMLVRSVALRIGGAVPAPLLKALDGWAEANADWLGLKKTRGWNAARKALSRAGSADPPPSAIAVTDVLSDMLSLSEGDAALLRLVVGTDRLSRLAGLTSVWLEQGRDLAKLLVDVASADDGGSAPFLRGGVPFRLGLVILREHRVGVNTLHPSWTLIQLLDKASPDTESVLTALIGPRQLPRVGLDDFAHVADASFLVRLLHGAGAEKAAGINILIHGPPGTGKTEFAKTLASESGFALFGVGEADSDGDEPSRWDRVTALRLAQRIMARAGPTVLLFDEMEDLIGDARPAGDWIAGREGSKLFVNRLLEENPVPVIWTTNAVGNVDAAILRRMSYILKLDLPTPSSARRMLECVARDEGVRAHPEVQSLLDRAPETATVLRVAVRAGRLAGDEEGGARSAASLVRALRGSDAPLRRGQTLDLDLFDCDVCLAGLMQQLSASGGGDVSLLLTGPPGTGKTELAHHIARAVDRPLAVRRASDLLSKWVGGTEQAIAQAFADARERGEALFFDEADSLLFDRTSAAHSWEVGQVNEMLTWLDAHPFPVIAATNHGHRIDPAALRRFAFKIDLRPLGRGQAAKAFERFFGLAPPPRLAELASLTPGDFAAVSRQLRHRPARDTDDLVDRLSDECAWKPSASRIGF